MENQTKPILRLFWALLIMLGFAGLEFMAGSLMGIHTIMADGMSMLGHCGLLGLALVLQFVAGNLPDAARARTEGFGGLAIAAYLFIMAVVIITSGGHGGHGGHHMHDMMAGSYCGTPPWTVAYSGAIIMGFAVLSIFIHAGTGKLLYGGKCHPLVLGACVHIFSHTFMAIAMLVGGFLMTVTNIPHLDMLMSYGIALFMAAGAGKLAYRSYGLLRQPS